MKFFVTAALGLLLSCACTSMETKNADHNDMGTTKRAPATAQDPNQYRNGLTVHGQKAFELMGIMDKAGAADASDDPCGMGHCNATGTMAIQCLSPNGPHKKNDITCDVTAAQNPKKSLSLKGAKASRLVHTFEAANAIDDSEDSCSMGSCYETGTISVDCIYPNGPTHTNQYDCDVTAVKKPADDASTNTATGVSCLSNQELKKLHDTQAALEAAKKAKPGCEKAWGAAGCLSPFDQTNLNYLLKKQSGDVQACAK